jgi:multidrug efflux pump subunit AcrB
VREAVIAAALTALMVLLFLGSWRSTVIIAISIPLSILASIICLSALGETINIMTLGGLALAVGILVDDATVTIENMNWHLERGEEVETAILNGAREIALPALVSTLAICIVFVPMFLLAGIARFLFVPLAEAVVFAMLASYLLSRTLVPTLAKYWLQPHEPEASASGFLARFQARFERSFLRSGGRFRAARASPCHSCSPWRRRRSWRFPWVGTFRAWGRTTFRAWTAGRSGCTCGRAPGCASTRRRRCAMRSRTRSALSFRRRNSTPSSTTSACPTAASI